MNRMLRFLRKLVLVLLVMAGTAVLAVWLMVVRDRRKSAEWQPAKPPVISDRAMASAAATSEAVQSPDGDLDWSRQEIRTLKEHVSNRTIIALLELLRDCDGAPVNYQELMEHTGRTMPQVRADLAVFSRNVKNVGDHQHWPVDTTQPTDGQSGIAYTAPKPYLDWWFEE